MDQLGNPGRARFLRQAPAVAGTGNPKHMAENVAAGTGVIPDPAFWKSRIDAVLG